MGKQTVRNETAVSHSQPHRVVGLLHRSEGIVALPIGLRATAPIGLDRPLS